MENEEAKRILQGPIKNIEETVFNTEIGLSVIHYSEPVDTTMPFVPA